MKKEIKTPQLPESVSDATVAKWHKKPGDAVGRGEVIGDLETDKVALELPAPEAGVLFSIEQETGATVVSGQLLAVIDVGAAGGAKAKPAAAAKPEPAEAAAAASSERRIAPAARRLIEETGLDAASITGTGKQGSILKEDVLAFIRDGASRGAAAAPAPAPAPAPAAAPAPGPAPAPSPAVVSVSDTRGDKRVPMTRLRARTAERLVQSRNETAALTTFNEVNMAPVISLRKKFGDEFLKQHDVKLGFMSIFAHACIEALRVFPVVNASIDGQDIVYHNYFDIGVAISSPKGLTVPVIRNADQLTLAQVEKRIIDFSEQARSNKLTLDDLTGGTFSITNGGVFGSMLSTPLINPPQTAILGMHTIRERPVVEDGAVVVRPMMYLALTYDHRLIDGREAVQFLVRIKHSIEEPSRLLLNL